MRVGILTHSFAAGWRIHLELSHLPDIETFILLSPSPDRPIWVNALANLARLAICSVKNIRNWPVFNVFSGRVLFLLKGFNHARSVIRIRNLDLDVGLHKSGVIYRSEIIDTFHLGILNPHIGLLPGYRGRSVMEWALLQGDPVGVSVFFVDTGIDTGTRIVVSEEIDISHCRSLTEAKRFLFDLDSLFFRKALAVLREDNPIFKINDDSGRRYYVMSRLFRDVVGELLQERH